MTEPRERTEKEHEKWRSERVRTIDHTQVSKITLGDITFLILAHYEMEREISVLKEIEKKWNAVKDQLDIDKTAKYNIIKNPTATRRMRHERP